MVVPDLKAQYCPYSRTTPLTASTVCSVYYECIMIRTQGPFFGDQIFLWPLLPGWSCFSFLVFYFFTLYAEVVDRLKRKINNISPGGHSSEKS